MPLDLAFHIGDAFPEDRLGHYYAGEVGRGASQDFDQGGFVMPVRVDDVPAEGLPAIDQLAAAGMSLVYPNACW